MSADAVPVNENLHEGVDDPFDLAAMLAAERRESAHLRVALMNARVIGMAMGIIVERLKCTPGCAFDTLMRISQHQNRKLRLVAQELLVTGELPDVWRTQH